MYGTGNDYDTLAENTNTNLFDNSYNNNESGNLTSDNSSVEDRLRQIERREKICIQQQQELDEQENRLRKLQKRRRPPKNWPTKQLGWARNAISIDIPQKYQKEVKEFYFFWCVGCFGTMWNFLVCLWYGLSSASNGDSDFKAIQYLIAICYILIGMPAAWMWWYKRYYRAMQKDGKIPQLFFMFLFLHLLYLAMMALGFSVTASMGFLVMIRCIANNKSTAIIIAIAINCLIFVIAGLGGLWLLRVAYRAFGRWWAKKYIEEEHQKMQGHVN